MSTSPDPAADLTQSVENEQNLNDVELEQLPQQIIDAVHGAGWTTLTPVQSRTIPHLLAQRDVMVQARTGSGKTGAFLLPMLQCLNPKLNRCQALVLVPTRELARQVYQESLMLCRDAGLRSVAVYGGVGYGEQNKALEQGAHIVIGTPGRVLDHLLRRTLRLDKLDMLIFDEADRMLSMGFYPDMKEMQRYLPDRRYNACMFSATFPIHVRRTANQFLRDPEFLSLSTDHIHVTDTDHIYYMVPDMGRERNLVRLIEVENPSSAIIFCNTKVDVHFIAVVLQRFGYDADELSADLSQNDRERVLKRVREGNLRFLVATDVAARGLDIPELSHVFQYELPEDLEGYIHRAGRTGRAGAAGVAISLVRKMDMVTRDRIAKRYGIEMRERQLPTPEDVETVVTERLTALLEARLRDRDNLQAERSRRFIPLARSLAENEEESAIMAMLLDDYYQQMLHKPLAQPSETETPRAQKQSSGGGRSRSRSRNRSRSRRR